MSDIEKMYNDWMNQIDSSNEMENGFNVSMEEWTPRVKWFKPPQITIFRWAYKIKRTLLKNCYPVSCSSSLDTGNREISFKYKKYDNPKINAMVEDMKHYMLKFTLEDESQHDQSSKSRSIKDILDGDFFSHNEIIAIWAKDPENPGYNLLVYKGEAWATPNEYYGLKFCRYFGAVPESIWESDVINILVEGKHDDIVCGLTKKKRNTSECTERRQDEC